MSANAPIFVSLQRLVQDFFEKHLSIERHASRHTILAYRDSIKLSLHHAAQQLGRNVDELDFSVLDVERVRCFLEWLQTERQCGARTRNHRLASLKTFVRYVASVAPEHWERCRRIRELRPAPFERSEVHYLDEDEILEISGPSIRRMATAIGPYCSCSTTPELVSRSSSTSTSPACASTQCLW